MEPLTITIQPPITEYCRDCEYEVSRSFHSHRAQCPECGSKGMSSGARPPEKRAMVVHKYQASFYLNRPSDKQWMYTFYNSPDDNYYTFVVEEEIDTDDVLECALELKEIINKYLINSSKSKINKLVEMIDDEDFQEEQKKLRAEEKRLQLERDIFKLNESYHMYK